MVFYLAPMEGLTGYIYRNAFNMYFHGTDKFFSPFICANQSRSFKTKELKDILPEHNQGLVLIPQLLSNNADDFIFMVNKLKQMGYDEINFNLGCPSMTVVSRGRGSGFLAKRDDLDKFLDRAYSVSTVKISIKTRIGKDKPEEFYDLIGIFNKYPVHELIIHPRIQKDMYGNKPDMKVFKDALSLSINPVCYNGDIFTVKDHRKFAADFHSVDKVMIGRGSIANPGLIENIKDDIRLDKDKLKCFHDKIYQDYIEALPGEKPVLFRMKELWSHMICVFTDNVKYDKRIKKSESFSDYEEAITGLFNEQDILTGL
ncbi:MAG: tRNA-dihydrouridine synthase family protein [Clostridia bacterium]